MKKLTCADSLRFPLLAVLMLMASVRIAAADSLTVQWDRNTEPEVDGYVVHVGSQPSTYTQTFDVGNTDTFTLTTVVPGQRYCFAVTAYDGSTTSGFSNEVCGYSNQNPTLTAPGNQNGVVGIGLTLQLTGSDPEGQSVSYSASGLPAGLTIASGSGLISGTPTTASVSNVSVSVSDGVLTTTQSFTWTITAPVNGPPSLTNPGNRSGTVGQAVSLQLQASDPNGGVLSYSASNLPTGLSVATSSGLISGTPTAAGTFNVTATVSDGSLVDIELFTWTIVLPPTAPTLTVVPNQSGTVGVAASLQLIGGDVNGDSLTYSATGLPGGLSIASSTGIISGTPTTAGTFSVTATVSDGSLSASRSFTWTIALPNAAPTLAAVANQTGVVGQAAALQLQASDVDGDPLTFSATGLPGGVTIASSTGLISGTPTAAGTFTVTAKVTDDGSLNASRTFTWTITQPNGAPTLAAVPNQSGIVGVAASLQLTGADTNGDSLTYSATGLPGGLTTASSTGTISGTPTTAGTFTVTATVSDGSLSAIRSFTWTIVQPNGVPTLAAVANQTGTVGQTAALQLQASDVDGDPLTFTATGLPGGLTVSSSTGLISGTPTAAGTFAVTATVTDDGSLSAVRSFTWTIAGANVAPTLATIANQSGVVGQASSLQLQGNDTNGDTLSYAASGLPTGLSVAAGTGLISGTPGTAGTFNVTATVSDGSLTASHSFTWTIAPPNVAPVLTNPGPQTGTVAQAASVQLQATDSNGDAITFGAAGLPPGLQVSTSTGLITGSPTTAGAYTVTVTASDGQLSVSQSFTWTIQDGASQNGTPSLSNPGTQRTDQGVAVALQLVATDPDNDPLIFSGTNLPPGLAISSSGLVSGTPTTAGTYTVTAFVTDGTLAVSKGFTWIIRDASVAPTLSSVANQSGVVGQAAALQLVGADTNGEALTYSATGLPNGLSVASATGLISGTPTAAGTFNVTATVSDGSLSASRSFTWTIAVANVAPTLAAVANPSGTVGVAAVLQLAGADANGDVLTYSAIGLPNGLSIAASTGLIAGTPTTAGTFTVTATVSDGNLSANRNFTWTIAEANVAPTLATVGSQSGTVGVATSLQLVGADVNGNTLTYSASGLPAGLSIAAGTGLISGTPTTAATFTVTATVSDGSLSANRSFTWTISAVNVAPTLATVASQSGVVGVAASLQLVGADANGDALTYSATGLPGGLSIAAGSGLISGTPTTTGTFNVTTTVSDGTLSASRSFTWTITVVTAAPTLATVASQSGTIGVPSSLQLVGADANGDPLTYSASGLPGGLSVAGGTGLISGTPTTAGTFNVTATVSDGALSASRSFTWTIVPENVAPTLATVANQLGTVGVASSLHLVGADANGNTLTYSVSGLPGGLSIATGTGLISGTPTTAGTFNVTATVSDGILSANRSFTWTIEEANVAPTLALVANQSGMMGLGTSLQLLGADANGNTLTYSAIGLPNGLSVAGVTGLISGTPTTVGMFSVTATVSDGRLSASRSFTWTITSPTATPVLNAVANQSGTVGVARALQLVGADANGNALTYSASGLPNGLSVAGATGLISGTPTTAGTFNVTATVSNGSLSTSRSFTWTIVPGNVAPTLATVANQSGTVGVASSLQLVGADANGNTLTYSASGLPAGLTVAGGTGLIAGTPTNSGTFTVTAAVSDGSLSATRSFIWTVAEAVQDSASNTLTGMVALTRTRATPVAVTKDYTGAKARPRSTPVTSTTDTIPVARASARALIDGAASAATTSGSSSQGSMLVAHEPATATAPIEEAAVAVATELVPPPVITGTAPEVTIDTPVEGASFGTGALVIFSATAHDAEEGTLSSRVVWTSSLDGKIGTGGTVLKVLRRGTHVITATVTDGDGLTKAARITIRVGQ